MDNIEITPELLADLKAKAEKATPGPWTILDECHYLCTEPTDECPPMPVAWVSHGPGIPPEQSENNEDYLMAVSPDLVLALISEIEDLRSRQTAQGVACCECQEVEVELRQEIESLRQERQILRDSLKKAVEEND